MSSEAAGALPEVVYIMGASRSGSTILGVVLDQETETFYAGELCEFAARSGDSTIASSRELWHRIRDRVGALPADASGFKMAFEHPLGVFRPVRSALSRRRYETMTERLFAAIRDETGCARVVDSSHYPRRARTLRRLIGKDKVRLVFVTRRPSAVTRSFRSTGDKGWLASNAYLAVVGVMAWAVYITHPRANRARVRLEALVADPRSTGSKALGRPMALIDPTDLQPGQAFMGNRLLKEGGTIRLRPIEQTRRTLSDLITDLVQWPYRIGN